MATSHLHCLHYEGYAHSAFLAELVIITRILFSGLPTSAFSYGIVFALGLLQGFFSFDYVFVATGAAIPLAMLARENGRSVEVRLVARLVALSGAGFAIAHLLHFWQVAHFYGSVSAALNDFSSRATYRFVGAGPTSSYLTQVMHTFERYSRELWLSPGGLHFGAFLLLFSAFSVSGIVRGTNGTAGTNVGQWRLSLMAKRNCAVMLFVAYGIGAVWLMAMPSYCRIHPHVVPQIFFLPYYVAVLAVALRLFGSDAAMERANP